jgi:hypothetical protein
VTDCKKLRRFELTIGDVGNRPESTTAIQRINELEQKTYEQSSGFSDYQKRIAEKVEKIINLKSTKSLQQQQAQLQLHRGGGSTTAIPYGNQVLSIPLKNDASSCHSAGH